MARPSIESRIASLNATIKRLESTSVGFSYSKAAQKGQTLSRLRRELFELERLLRRVQSRAVDRVKISR